MIRLPPSELVKAAVCGAVGLVAMIVALIAGPWQLAILVGWVTGALLMLILIWSEIAPLDAEATRRVALREDDSRNTTRSLIVAACVVSLIVVATGLHRAASADRTLEVALTAGAMATVVLAWLLVHTLFTLRYAHLYYDPKERGEEGESGIEFPNPASPDYLDFAYVAFSIGMTFQVSDTPLTSPSMRRTVLRHALLSYLFGTAIIASTISVLAGFVV